jgi:hypothetical protein
MVQIARQAFGCDGCGAGDDDVTAGVAWARALPVTAVLFPVPACPSIITI